MEMLKQSTTLAVVGQLDAASSTDQLTAITKSYNVAVEDTSQIVDKLVAVDLNYAASTGEISTALQKVASSAGQAGLGLDKLIGLITISEEKTRQAPEVIGSAWQSIIARIGKITAKVDLDDLVDENGKVVATINDADKVLSKYGINLVDTSGKMRDMGTIMDEIGAKWGQMSTLEQNQLAYVVAGVRQRNVFIAAMEDYNKVLEATSVAENANGVAAEKMTVYNESLEAAQNRLTASVQQFAQDSNLDRTLALAYDGLSKVVEILNILLNKIPVLSPLIKALGVALATAFASNMLNNLAKTSTGIGTIISTIGGAIPNLQKFVSLVGSKFVTAMTAAGGGLAGLKAGAIAAGGAITTLINPITLTIAGLGALLVIIPKVVTWFNNLKNAKENALKQSSQELDEANQNLEETNSQIKDIQDKISEINSKDSMTLTDQAEKERLEEELETLKQIKQVQEDIAASKKSETLQGAKDVVTEKYGGEDKSVDEYLSGLKQNTAGWKNFTMSGSLDSINTASDSINELAANVKYLDEQKKELNATDSDYQEKLDAINQKEQENTQQLLSKKQELLEYKQQLIDLGDTSSEEYQLVNDKINDITVALDPSKLPKVSLSEMISTEGMEEKIKMVVETGSEAGKKVATSYAENFAKEISKDDSLRKSWAEALNIDENELKNNTSVLTQEILALFQEMYGGISEASKTASQGFTAQHTALDAYNEAVQNVHDSTTDLTAAYQDMISKGYISESVVKKLTAAHPELTKELKLENGQYKINLQTLKDVYTAEVNKSIASMEAEKKQTKATAESIQQRIDMYQKEVDALTDQAIAMGDESAKARLIGAQHSLDRAKWELADIQKAADGVDKYINDLKQNAANWSPTKSSGSKSSGKSGKSAADKAAKEFEDSIKEKVKNLKSIVQLYSENANWDDPTVIKEFQDRYDKLLNEVINDPKARKVLADAFNLDISNMPVEQQIQELTTLWQKQAGTIQESYQKLLKNLAKEDLSSAKAVIEKYKDGIYGAWSSDEALNAAKADYQKFIDKITNDADYRAAMAEALNLGDISGEPVEKQIEAVTSALLKSTGTLDDAQQDLYDDASKNIKALQDEIEDMIDTAIDLLEKAGDFLFDMLDKISDRYDAQIDNLDKISDELDDQKDAFEDKIDQQKELLKLQKEEMDNADELAEKNKSIADIDAQLMELQYDNSAEAQAKRLKLLDERAEKEKDLADWQKDNDYNVKIDALDKEKSEYEKTIEAEKKAIEAQKQILKDAQSQFKTTLGNIQNGFNTFIKILSSDLVKNLISKALIGTGQDTVTNLLTGYNRIFGSGIDSDVTGTIKTGYKSLQDIGAKITGDFGTIAQDITNTTLKAGRSLFAAAGKEANSLTNLISNGITSTSGMSAKQLVSLSKAGNGALKTIASNGVSSIGIVGQQGQSVIASLGNVATQVVNTVVKNGMNLVSGIGGIIQKIANGIGGLLGIGGIGLSSVPGMTVANTAGLTGLGGLAAKAGISAGAAGTGTIAAGGLATAGLGGLLPVLGIGLGVGLGGLGAVANIKKITEVAKNKDATTADKVKAFAPIFAATIPGLGLIPTIMNVVDMFKKHHSGADYVKKGNPMLDKMLGLGSDETVSILKVGEAVVPTWANSASSSASGSRFTGSPFGSAVDSAVKSARASTRASQNTGGSTVNISMPITINGDADASTVKALRKEADNIVKRTIKEINNQTRIGGYKNIKAATV